MEEWNSESAAAPTTEATATTPLENALPRNSHETEDPLDDDLLAAATENEPSNFLNRGIRIPRSLSMQRKCLCVLFCFLFFLFPSCGPGEGVEE